MEMQSLGLSPHDLNPSGPLSSRRALARAQSAQVMSKKFLERDRIKHQMKEEEVHGRTNSWRRFVHEHVVFRGSEYSRALCCLALRFFFPFVSSVITSLFLCIGDINRGDSRVGIPL